MSADPSFWKRCNSCRNTMPYNATYWVCNVSTCNRKPLNMVFCSMPCWDSHLPMMRHREAWAEERRAPSFQEWEQELAAEAEAESGKRRRRVPPVSSAVIDESAGNTGDILVVASKLKTYIRDRSEFNTAGNVMPHLSNLVRELCTEAIRNAAMDDRKTVMDRDFRKTLRDTDL